MTVLSVTKANRQAKIDKFIRNKGKIVTLKFTEKGKKV